MAPDPKPTRSRRAGAGRRARSSRETSIALEWQRRATALGCRVCPALGEECEGVVQGHHVLYRKVIREHVATLANDRNLTRLEREEMLLVLSWDHGNALGVCYRAHRRHHSGIQPIPRSLIPPAALRFADSLGLLYRIESAYPVV